MLKRIRRDCFSSPNPVFLTESNLQSCTVIRCDFREQRALHDGPQVSNPILERCMPDPFRLQKTDFDILQQASSQVLTGVAATNGLCNGGDAVHSEGPESLVDNQLSETTKNNCWHGLPVTDSPFTVRGSQSIDGMPPFHSKINGCNAIIPNNVQADITVTGKRLLLGGELSNNNVCSMVLSPPVPNLPLWKMMEDITATDMWVNVENAQDVSELPGNYDSKSCCVNVQKNKSSSADKQNIDSFSSSLSISDGDFVDFPDSLFDFSNDDMLFMDVNGKSPVDRSCCDNTLSNVPIDTADIDALKVGEEAMMVANASTVIEPEVLTSHLHAVLGEERPVSHVKVQMSSASTLNNEPLERGEGKLYCAFNSEELDIPCNDDNLLLIHPDIPYATFAKSSMTKSAMVPVSVKDRDINSVQGLNSVKKREELAQSSKSSQMFISYMLPEMVQVGIGGRPIVSAESNNKCKDLALRDKTVVDSTQCKPSQISEATAAGANFDKDAVDTQIMLRELPLHADTSLVETFYPKPLVNPSTSDQEGLERENEDLHFSDIEAVILNMDLGSYDDDLHFTRRVSKYQQENSKRTIMRLEQCARVSIRRALTSQGALAFLYGRHSRHFIRKTEVLLGRSTEETVVDIDLGKEGCHNKISRRQAILKMEDDGSFTLKNLAKNSILVNGTEVGIGELIGLSSSCLIEIKGISFAFESNQKYVKRYLENIGKKKGQMANFEWLPKEELAMS